MTNNKLWKNFGLWHIKYHCLTFTFSFYLKKQIHERDVSLFQHEFPFKWYIISNLKINLMKVGIVFRNWILIKLWHPKFLDFKCLLLYLMIDIFSKLYFNWIKNNQRKNLICFKRHSEITASIKKSEYANSFPI